MSKCRYDLSEDYNNKDCIACVLDKIRTEIIESAKGTMNDTRAEGLYMALRIIDKYKAEGSDKE